MSYSGAGASRKERADWFECKKGAWRKGVQDPETKAWSDDLFDALYGNLIGFEFRRIEAKGKYPAHDQLVITLGGGDRPVKGTIYSPSVTVRMFGSFVEALRADMRVSISVFTGTMSEATILLIDDAEGKRLPRTPAPAHLKEAVDAARAYNATVPEGAPAKKQAERDLEDAQDNLNAFWRQAIERHPLYGRTAISPAIQQEQELQEEVRRIDPETGEYIDSESAQTSAEATRETLNRASVSAQAPAQIIEEAREALGMPAPELVPSTSAFGFTAPRWPTAADLAGEALAQDLVDVITSTAAGRKLGLDTPMAIKHLWKMVLGAYGVPEAGHQTKGGAILVYDFVKSAPDASIVLALAEFDPFAE